jgi:hypothetical protein
MQIDPMYSFHAFAAGNEVLYPLPQPHILLLMKKLLMAPSAGYIEK